MAQPDEQGFLSHLIELRQRLVRAAASVLIVFVALSPFMRQIFELFARPIKEALPPGADHLLAISVIDPFLVPLKVTLFASLLIALPYVLYQVWAFVAPGLYRHEKRLMLPVIVSSVLMFFAGMAYCYFVVLRVLYRFMVRVLPKSVTYAPDIDKYFGNVLSLFLAFGLAFEVPIAVLLLVRLGMVSVARLRQMRPYVIVGAFVVAAIFTPPDVVSQLLLALPLCLLFELGVLLGALFGTGGSASSESQSGPAPS